MFGGLITGNLIVGGRIDGGVIEGGLMFGGLISGGLIAGGLTAGGVIAGGAMLGGLIAGGSIFGGWGAEDISGVVSCRRRGRATEIFPREISACGIARDRLRHHGVASRGAGRGAACNRSACSRAWPG